MTKIAQKTIILISVNEIIKYVKVKKLEPREESQKNSNFFNLIIKIGSRKEKKWKKDIGQNY